MSDMNASSIDPIGIVDGYAATLPGLPPPDQRDQDLYGRCQKMFLSADSAQTRRMLNSNLYLAAIMGDQYLALDPESGIIYRVLDNSQSQYVSQNNQLIALHLALWGKLTKAQPDFSVTSSGGSLDEVYGAKAAERFIEYYRTARNTKQIIDNAKQAISWAGHGLVELSWDPLGGSDFYHCDSCGYQTEEEMPEETPCPHCEQLQQQYQQAQMQYQQAMQQPQQPAPQQPGMPPQPAPPPPQPPQPPPPPGVLQCLNRGGPTICNIDPRNVYFQPGVEKFENMQWYIVREPLPVQVVRNAFPEHALEIYAELDVYPNHGAQYSINEETGEYTNEHLQDHVYLYRLVEKPTALHKDGRIIFWCNNKIIGQAPGYMRAFGRLPLFRFGWIPQPGTPYFRPPAADAWHRQRELNRLETQMSEHTSLVARTKAIIPYGSRIAVDELSAQSAQILMPTPTTANMIRYLAPPPMSQDIYQRRELLTGDMRTMFAVTVQETAAQTDPNGRYAAIAEAESDQTVGPIIRQHHQEEADMMRCLLVLVQMLGDPDEKFWALGDNNQENYMFQDIMFKAKKSNVAIQPSDGLSGNSALRQQQANTMVQLGLLGAPGQIDKSAYVKISGINVPGFIPDSSDTEIQAALSAIKILEDGQPYQPKVYDDPNIFCNTLMSWLRSNGRRQEQINPTLVQQVSDLFQYYQNQIFQAQQAAAAQAAPTGPGGPGQPSSTAGNNSSAPGGSPNAPQANQSSGASTNDAAAEITKNADKAGESAVRGALKHEG